MPKLGNPIPFTGHAMRALQLSIAFAQTFRGAENTPVAHTLTLDTPPGTSTGGGENVAQTVKLTVRSAKAVSIATANAAARTVEIAKYEDACAAFGKANAGAPFPFDRDQYTVLVNKLASFFAKEKIATPDASADGVAHPSARAVEPARARVLMFLVVGVTVIAVAAAIVLTLR